MKSLMLLSLAVMMLVTAVFADNSDYIITVKDNGEALIIVTINGTGLYRINLQEDVSDIKVKGALYSMHNRTAEISIGSIGKAIALYKTSTLTSKRMDAWTLQFEAVKTNSTRITVNLPRDVRIDSTEPEAFIEEDEYKKITFAGNLTKIRLAYTFSDQGLPTIQEEDKRIVNTTSGTNITARKIKENITNPAVILAIGAVVALPLVYALKKRGNGTHHAAAEKTANNEASANKRVIIKTLPKNEESIVSLLLQNSGSLKRSMIEKQSKIAKSSLAGSLANLERKNIIEVDRTNTTHFVKFTKWFEEL
jgi:uncharacterized membrane protein